MTIILVLLTTSLAWSRSNISKFNEVLTEDVQKDIKKDEDRFKSNTSRSPASVPVEMEVPIQDTPKLDKNIRQIGPNKW